LKHLNPSKTYHRRIAIENYFKLLKMRKRKEKNGIEHDELTLFQKKKKMCDFWYIVDHGTKLSLTCTLTSMALSTAKDVEVDKLAVLTTAITFVFRFLTGLLHAAQLSCSSSNLKATASSLLRSKHCYKMTQEERSFAFLFIHRLQDHQLAACPRLNLYCVTYSILLTVLSLTVSYVMILFQFK